MLCCPAAGGATAASGPPVIVFTPLIGLVAVRPCVRLRIIFCGTPWHCLLALPLCRCQGGGLLFVSVHQMLDANHCNKKSHVSTLQTQTMPLCRCGVFRGRVPAIQ